MALEIVGAGFGRTGTHSLKLALEQLGFGPCHHMFEIRDNPDQLPAWENAAEGIAPDFDLIFEGYRAQVDWPGARYWRELAEVYPQSRIILTVRDPQEWFDSIEASLVPLVRARGTHPNPFVNRLLGMADRIVAQGVFGGDMANRGRAIEIFERHCEDVRATIEPERLLVFNVSQGWDPLCAFLGVDVPSEPFPWTNSSRTFREKEWK